ncbi:MAG: hypothetical protein EA416_11340, partial [Trueperaceae bacterium]
MATLSIRLLGGLRVERGDDALELGPQRVSDLIAYLVVHRYRPIPRAHLAYVMWPESDEAQARTNVRKTLHQLRHSLPDAAQLLAMDGQTLRWRPGARFDVDVERFDQATQRAQQAQASGARGLEREHLEEAARIYRGDLLPEMYDDWLEAERERLRQRFATVLERLVDVLWQQRDDRAALGYAQRLVRHDPLVESSYRRLMRLHARSGERAKALHVYHSCASVLQEQLQVGPSDETVALYQDVLRLQPNGASHAVEASPKAHRQGVISGAPLVGRYRELGALRAAWDETQGGPTGLVLVTGDPGIGKTRLVEEFARSLPRREAAAITTRCRAAERSLAFTPVVALLRTTVVREALPGLASGWRRDVSRLLPELVDGEPSDPGPLTEGWQRQRLFEALSHAILASQPLVAVIDDVQWCDGDSLDWLHYLLRFDANARRMLVATARTHELDANPRLGDLLLDLERDGLLTRIELAPLSDDETGTLARSLHRDEPEPGALSALVAETEGNPLFVVEMVREGALASSTPRSARETGSATTLPRRLRAVIASRLERLSAPSSELLGMAAVIGREFDFDVLLQVSRQDEDVAVHSLDELWRRRIVRELGAGQYDFSHDKLREVTYGALSLTHRRLLHRYTAEALEALDVGERDDVSGRIAFHYDRAGDHERAIAHYRRAAAAARSRYAHEEVLSACERALELIAALSPSAVLEGWLRLVAAEFHEGVGDVLELKAQHADARERFERALAQRSGDAIATARLWRKVGLTSMAQYGYDEAGRAYAAAEAALGSAETDADTTWWRAWIDVQLARSNTYYWQLAWRECERVLASLEHAVMQHGTALQRCFYFRDMGDKDFAKRRLVVTEERLSYARAALAAAEESGSTTTIAAARFSIGFAYLWHDDLAQAAEHLEAALATSVATGDSVLRTRCLAYLCFLHRKLGAAATTERYAYESLSAAHELTMPEYVGAAHGHLAWLAWRRRDHDACVREGRAALASWATGQRYPLQWCARLPLLASSVAQELVSDALAHATA